MALKASGRGEDWEEIDRFEAGTSGGVGWIAHPDERIQRASHALVDDGDVWLIEPVDAVGIDEFLADLGTVVGVVVLLDRHTRDADRFARHYDVPIYVSDLLTGVAADINADVERYHRDLGDTGYAAYEVVDRIGWHEIALFDEESRTLVLADALGTAGYFLVGEERLGVHPLLRFRPPKKLARLRPARILVGHGEGIHHDVQEALEDAVDGARRRLPGLYWQNLKSFVGD